MDFLQSLTASVGQAVTAPGGAVRSMTMSSVAGRAGGLGMSGVAPAAPPVIQLNAVPVTIDPGIYADARGPTNPGGSLLPLYAFRSLVDPIPAATAYYTPSGITTEQAYGSLLQGASVVPPASSFVELVLGNARRQFDLLSLPSLDGTPGNQWRPVYADPPDWYAMDPSRFRPLSSGAGPAAPGADTFTMLGAGSGSATGAGTAAAALAWHFLDASRGPVPLDPQTRILSTSLRYLEVTISRPWLDVTLFHLTGWGLQGQPKGLYSNGETEGNPGLMPLLPVALILGIDAEVTATWSAGDHAVMAAAAAHGTSVSLGPIPVAPPATSFDGSPTTLRSVRPFIVGWVSTVVPLLPPNDAS